MDSIDKKQSKHFKIASFFLLPVVVFVAFRAQDILFFLSKETLESLLLPFQLFVWATFFVYYDFLLIGILAGSDRKRAVFLSCAVGIASLALLNFYLVPRYGLLGLATAVLMTSAIVFVFAALSFAKGRTGFSLYGYCEDPAVAAMSMMLVLHYAVSWNFAAVLLSGAAGYALTLYVLVALNK
jgi:O-antigen/teichoic acid export membrane protein